MNKDFIRNRYLAKEKGCLSLSLTTTQVDRNFAIDFSGNMIESNNTDTMPIEVFVIFSVNFNVFLIRGKIT